MFDKKGEAWLYGSTGSSSGSSLRITVAFLINRFASFWAESPAGLARSLNSVRPEEDRTYCERRRSQRGASNDHLWLRAFLYSSGKVHKPMLKSAVGKPLATLYKN